MAIRSGGEPSAERAWARRCAAVTGVVALAFSVACAGGEGTAPPPARPDPPLWDAGAAAAPAHVPGTYYESWPLLDVPDGGVPADAPRPPALPLERAVAPSEPTVDPDAQQPLRMLDRDRPAPR